MKKLIRWCYWELNNEFLACAYFTVILLMYGIIDLIFGIQNINIWIIFEMFCVNYLLSTLQKLILDLDKEYSKKSFILRAVILSTVSVIAISIAGKLGGWFHKMPFWASLTIYAMLILSYITVWIIISLGRKQDTKKLNEQLANYKRTNQQN